MAHSFVHIRFLFFAFLRNIWEVLILGILDQQATYEVLGQLAGVAEILLIKVVVDSWDVCQGLLLGLAQKRRRAAQPTGSQRKGLINTWLRSRWFTALQMSAASQDVKWLLTKCTWWLRCSCRDKKYQPRIKTFIQVNTKTNFQRTKRNLPHVSL